MMTSLENCSIGIRIFDTTGDQSPDKLALFDSYIHDVERFQQLLQKTAGDAVSQVVIITNSDLDATRRSLLERVRPHVGVVEGNAGSYADMLGALSQADKEETDRHFYISWDMIAQHPDTAIAQIAAMNTVYDAWQQRSSGSLALLGSCVGVHDYKLVTSAIDGGEDISPDTVSVVFPLNTFSETDASTRFSSITDNGRLGTIEVEENQTKKEAPIGGNEDFYFGFEQMLTGRDCALLIEPDLSWERAGEVQGHAAKYMRRKKVYGIYMDRLVREAMPSQELTREQIENIATDAIHRHLFFVRINNADGRPEVVLTAKQREIGVTSPLG